MRSLENGSWNSRFFHLSRDQLIVVISNEKKIYEYLYMAVDLQTKEITIKSASLFVASFEARP